MTAMEELAGRWRGLMGRLGEPLPAAAWVELARRYGEGHRGYHDARHIAECLALLAASDEPVADPTALELAIWYHDVIYDPRATDNEEQSAALATTALAPLGAATVERVAALIRCTADHEPGDLPDAPLLMDIDLAILGAEPTRFAEFEAGIRHEYAWVPIDRYQAARADVLASFLARPRLYHTVALYREREAAARRNLTATIAVLRK